MLAGELKRERHGRNEKSERGGDGGGAPDDFLCFVSLCTVSALLLRMSRAFLRILVAGDTTFLRIA